MFSLISSAVIDWIVSSLPKYVGLPVGPHMVNYLAFTVYLVVCVQTQMGLASPFGVLKDGVLKDGLAAANLTINAKKQQRFPFMETDTWKDGSAT